MNNRTVAQILEEFDPNDAKPIVAGEVENVRYALFEKPLTKIDEGDLETPAETKQE